LPPAGTSRSTRSIGFYVVEHVDELPGLLAHIDVEVGEQLRRARMSVAGQLLVCHDDRRTRPTHQAYADLDLASPEQCRPADGIRSGDHVRELIDEPGRMFGQQFAQPQLPHRGPTFGLAPNFRQHRWAGVAYQIDNW